jgi:hypothetical protein
LSIDVLRERLRNQKLTRSSSCDPADVVSWLGAVQAQDYPGAKWALGLRTAGITDAAIERAFNEGRILRTHILRPTWHFVSSADIRWMLALSGPRVQNVCASYFRKQELDASTLAKARSALQRALRGGKHRTRAELSTALDRAGVKAIGIRLAFIVMHAELEGLICSGPMRGKQFTYALLEERVPARPRMKRDEALAELTRRYFASHGPATVRDFVWWSGLTTADARAGLDTIRSSVRHETIGDRTYWFLPPQSKTPEPAPLYLLPTYDEYLIAYRDRGDPSSKDRPARTSGVNAYANFLVVDGIVAGTWKRALDEDTVRISAVVHGPLSRTQSHALADAADRYGAFLGRTVTVTRTTRH